MKNSNDTIGKRTRDLPACSALSQPTAPPLDPQITQTYTKLCRRSGWEIWQKVIPARIVAVTTSAVTPKHIGAIPTLFGPVTKLLNDNSENVRSVIFSIEK